MSRAIAIALVACACGRVGFGPAIDASPPANGRANYVFATSATYGAAFGGAAGADEVCATTASNAGLDGTFVAWIAGAPIERLDGSRGWTRVDGTPVADQPADFLTGSMLAPIGTDELGDDLTSSATPGMWTGIGAQGDTQDTCVGWTTNAMASYGTAGDLRAGGNSFTAATLQTCDAVLRIACLQIGFVTPIAVVGSSTRRLAFVSSEEWLPAGLASADATCQGDARDAGLSGTFLAALPTSTSTSASRFALTGAAWTRTDGTPLGATAASLFDAPALPAMINRRADRQVIAGATWWAGDPESLANSTCVDWTSTLSTDAADYGVADASDHASVFLRATGLCLTPQHLLCLQN